MPVLRAIAGPDGQDEQVREIELGDPAEVEFAGLDVVISDHASLLPVRRELREARERAAGALAAAGANVRRESMKSLRRALELFLMSLQDGAGVTTREILEAEGADPVGWRTAFKRGGPHTPATLLLLFSESVAGHMPAGRMRRLKAAAKSLARGGRGRDRRRDPAAPAAPPRRPAPPDDDRPVLAAHPDGHLQPRSACPPRRCRWASTPRACRSASRSSPAIDRDHMSIAAALELERVFGGWVPPGHHVERPSVPHFPHTPGRSS